MTSDKLSSTIKKMVRAVKSSRARKLKYNVQDQLPWTIIGRDLKLKKFTKMYNGYHVRYKTRFLKPLMHFAIWLGLKLNRRILGKSFIPPEKISREKANKVINVCNDTFMQTLKEAELVLHNDVKRYNDPMAQDYNQLMKLGHDIVMQNIIYDTYYRCVFEMYMYNLAINMGKAFKNDKNHVLYNTEMLDNINYYMAVERNDGNYFVLNEGDSIIVIPKGNAIRMKKKDMAAILEEDGVVQGKEKL